MMIVQGYHSIHFSIWQNGAEETFSPCEVSPAWLCYNPEPAYLVCFRECITSITLSLHAWCVSESVSFLPQFALGFDQHVQESITR